MMVKKGKSVHPFIAAFGAPNPALKMGIRFASTFSQELWEKTRIGAGYFDGGFLRLFDEGVARLSACLDAWSFLVPREKNRMILGYNAYGTILVLEKVGTEKERIHVLDPLRLDYWSHDDLGFEHVVGGFLPDRRLPHFFDDQLYRTWIGEDERLLDDYILAPKKPEPLGGTMEKSNFQEEEIVSYYQTTGPLYAKAFTKKKKKKGR